MNQEPHHGKNPEQPMPTIAALVLASLMIGLLAKDPDAEPQDAQRAQAQVALLLKLAGEGHLKIEAPVGKKPLVLNGLSADQLKTITVDAVDGNTTLTARHPDGKKICDATLPIGAVKDVLAGKATTSDYQASELQQLYHLLNQCGGTNKDYKTLQDKLMPPKRTMSGAAPISSSERPDFRISDVEGRLTVATPHFTVGKA